jgi:hypothetical protein
MASVRPRNFAIVRSAPNLGRFNTADNGVQVCAFDLNAIHPNCTIDVMFYGVKQLLADNAAGETTIAGKSAAVVARWKSLVDGTFKLGERIASGLVMADTFNAARTVGWRKSIDDSAARDEWKKLSDLMRARIAAMPEVIAKLAESHPQADSELESMFE